MAKFDFSGWATKFGIKCSDGRTIRKGAFQKCDGKKIPLFWNHDHKSDRNVLGHAFLEYRPEGVYTRAVFNDTQSGKNAKELVKNGDIDCVSIWANALKHDGSYVIDGDIKELSLVPAGANPGAIIDTVLCHGEDSLEEGAICTGLTIELFHGEDIDSDPENNDPDENDITDDDMDCLVHSLTEAQLTVMYAKLGDALGKEVDPVIQHAAEDMDEDETVGDIFNTLTEKQKNVVMAMIGDALEHSDVNDNNDPEGGDTHMKENVFNKKKPEEDTTGYVLTHADKAEILGMARAGSGMKLSDAIADFMAAKGETLSHGIDDIESLFPDFQNVKPGAPELITRDQGWVTDVITKAHKSPISRIRTRQTDIRNKDIRAKGYKKGDKKTEPANAVLLARTTEPQTVYRTDSIHRDDIVDITDFDVVEYQYQIMKLNLNEELATAIMVGDGRDALDENKIKEDKIRPIWTDADLYTIKKTVDLEAAKTELQGGDTSKHFGHNYIYSEAIVAAALYAREGYKGSGSMTYYCTPHSLNVMLLAKDLNGRRLYNSQADVAAALNVSSIQTVEQFDGLTRMDGTKEKALLGIFVNMVDYQIGATKGGEITKFNQFDIDFNKEKFLIETRCSGALTRVYSAIVLEEEVIDDPVNP